MLPREKGPCKDDQEKFYFDTKTGKCEKFPFGGCFGNLNNFESLDECESTCHALIEMAMSAKPVAVNMGNISYIFWVIVILPIPIKWFEEVKGQESEESLEYDCKTKND
jgi:hypothetical protein